MHEKLPRNLQVQERVLRIPQSIIWKIDERFRSTYNIIIICKIHISFPLRLSMLLL